MLKLSLNISYDIDLLELRLVLNISLLLLLLPSTVIVSQGCVIDNEVVILPNTSTQVSLELSDLLNADLGVNQSICGVHLVFDHDQLENIRITLTSPDGDVVTLVGPATLTGDLTDLITWNVMFTQCGNASAPDPGFNAVWDNNQNWQSFSTYQGVYYPAMGCLEDFDSGSANGTWLLEIENLGNAEGSLLYFELILCNDTGNNCSSCFLHVSEFADEYEVFCFEDSRLLDISDLIELQYVIDNTQDFSYVLSQGDSILSIGEELNNLDTLDTGLYTICGLVFSEVDQAVIGSSVLYSDLLQQIDQGTICADLSNNCLTIEILDANNIIEIDTSFCEGDTFMYRDLMTTESIDTVLTIFDTLSNQPFTITCDTIIRLFAEASQIEAVIDFQDPSVMCGQSIFLNGTQSSSFPQNIIDYDWTTIDGNYFQALGPISEIDAGGTYTLTVDNGLCQDSTSVIITAIDTFEFALDASEIFCVDDTIVVTASSLEIMDSISVIGPQPFQVDGLNFLTQSSGIYEVTGFLGTCETYANIEIVNQATEIDIEVSSNVIDCTNMSSEVIISINIINADVLVSGPEPVNPDQLTFEVMTPGLYNLTISDQSGCQKDTFFEIFENFDLPVFETESINRLCTDPPASLSLNVFSSYDSILWSGPNGFLSDELTPMVLEDGIYSLQVFGTNGCIGDSTIQLTTSNVQVNLVADVTNIDCVNEIGQVCINDSMSIVQFQWSYNYELLPDENTACISVDEAGAYSLVVVDDNGCTGEINSWLADLSEDLGVDINSDNPTLDCNFEIVELEASVESTSSDITFQWILNGQNTGEESSLTAIEEGNYILEVMDTVSQCSSIDSIYIESISNNLIDVFLDTEDPICEGESGQIFIQNLPPGVDLEMMINNTPEQLETSLQMSPGSYLIEIINAEGCIFDSTVVINEGNSISVDIGDDIFAILGEQVDLNVNLSIPLSETNQFIWSHPEILSCDQCLNPALTVFGNQSISLIVSDLVGCEAIDELNIIVDKNVDLFVPNIFTPNGDGDNDILTLFLSNQIVKIFDIRIIDRWGNLLFFHPEITKHANNFKWDGTFNGEVVGSGVYVFMAKLLLLDNTETIIVEEITLLR